MPSTYTHYQFGNDVLKRLPEKQKQEIQAHRDLFSIGLHGPDLLFYYHPLTKNPVNQVGYVMHDRPGTEFFSTAIEILRQKGSSAAERAYLYGFLCHFALDRECHGYIDEKIGESGVSHSEIEVELDRALLVRDGFDPLSKKLTDHIHPSREAARVIGCFFPDIPEKKLYKAIRSMVFYNNLLCAPGKGKRQFLFFLLRISGQYHTMRGLFINEQPNPQCADSCEKLIRLYDSALEKAEELLTELPENIAGRLPLNPLYRYTFGSQLLSQEEEDN